MYGIGVLCLEPVTFFLFILLILFSYLATGGMMLGSFLPSALQLTFQKKIISIFQLNRR